MHEECDQQLPGLGLRKSREGVARWDLEFPLEWNTRSTRVEPPSRRGPVSRGPFPTTTPLGAVTWSSGKTLAANAGNLVGSNLTEGQIYFSHYTLLEYNVKNYFEKLLNV